MRDTATSVRQDRGQRGHTSNIAQRITIMLVTVETLSSLLACRPIRHCPYARRQTA
jgi:hypothetical protein